MADLFHRKTQWQFHIASDGRGMNLCRSPLIFEIFNSSDHHSIKIFKSRGLVQNNVGNTTILFYYKSYNNREFPLPAES